MWMVFTGVDLNMTHYKEEKAIKEEREKATGFVWHYTMHSRRVYAYILTLVPHRPDAEDVFQNVGVTLWEKFDEFEEGTNFGAWACRIAWFKVLDFQQKNQRVPSPLSPSVLEKIKQTIDLSANEVDAEYLALNSCLDKLREKDRQLIEKRYQPEGLPQNLAEELQLPVKKIYKSLTRIRRVLLECITRTLSEEGAL
ncbi:hypothetical protein MNBD_PLANCTO02-2683 [hydrothermal vent metagenome]|uniref:RNA polymerase sigma-70 region 2 domain-containing protein n=1 Tax=hydrothermal vent metagenome TaxID=652676 RepID=A0A3B1D642_9ZZZZ